MSDEPLSKVVVADTSRPVMVLIEDTPSEDAEGLVESGVMEERLRPVLEA